MSPTKTILLKHKLPVSPINICFFDYCGPELSVNELPNCILTFSNRKTHQLTVKNLLGISEALQILELELNPIFYNPTSINDPKLKQLEEEEPVELKRYSHVTISGKDYTEYNAELVEAFVKAGEATLHTHPICGD